MKLLSKIGIIIAGLIIFLIFFLIGASFTDATSRLVLLTSGIENWEYEPKDQSVIYYSDGTELDRIGYKRIYSDDFPQFMKDTVIAVEDRRFYQHSGFDAKGIGRALWNNIRTGRRAEGGSTITQQLSRTIFLTQERTYTRKIKEVFVATALEEKLTKDDILNIYLNEIYMGRGTSGMGAAAKYYFGKDVMDLNRAEITMLVGIIQAPEFYNPEKNFEGIKQRQRTVLNVLVGEGLLSSEEANQIAKQQLNILAQQLINSKHPYYLAYVTTLLEREIDRSQLHRGGLRIYTTINSRMQLSGENIVKAQAQNIANQGIDANDIALVSIDPRTGGIRAMVGGVDFSRNQINMAVTPRQPGSAIKPLYYAAAIEHRLINDQTIVNNETRDFGGYSPQNYNNAPSNVTIREALVRSHNVASVEVLNILGVRRAITYLENMGITTIEDGDHNLALGLGGMTRGISPLQLTSAYTVFVNQGQVLNYYTIERVEDENQRILYNHRSQARRVISSNTAALMNSILIDVVRYGTGTPAQTVLTSSGKTGTTTDSRDLWYVGYTEELVTTVWIGNSDNRPITGYGAFGGRLAGPIFRDYMNTLYWSYVFEARPGSVEEEIEEKIPIDDEIEEEELDEELPIPDEIIEPDDDLDEGLDEGLDDNTELNNLLLLETV